MPIRATLTLLLLAAAQVCVTGCVTLDRDERAPQRHRAQRSAPALVRAPTRTPDPGEWYVFTSFREPGYGLHLAASRDGYTWTPAAGDRAILTPRIGKATGMRDPCIAQGSDGTFHLVWTWAYLGPETSHAIGYAHSRDLLNWEGVRILEVMPRDWPVDACWAPEIVRLPDRAPGEDEWLIVWSSAVAGRDPQTAKTAEANHRLYCTTTRDFDAVAPARLFLDPGYPVIDATFLKVPDAVPDQRWRLFFKDERQRPEKKQLRMTSGPTPEGPWGPPSPGLTIHWVEAPSAIRIGDDYLVYFDEYTRRRYGAIRSRDLEHWEDVSRLMSFPPGHRHGSVLRISEEAARGIGAAPADE